MKVLRDAVAWRQARPLHLPLSSPVRQQWRPTSALTPGLISDSHLHIQQRHYLEDHSTAMTNSKSQTDPKPTPKWQSVSWQKKEKQLARIPNQWRLPQLPSSNIKNYLDIPRQCGLLTGKELEITENYDATALAEAIRDRKLTCVDVTTAFCKVIPPKDKIERD